MGYTKLFSTIVTSSIWTADDATRIVWITMLAISDKNGEIHASIPGLARLAGVSLEACEKAITTFLSPDAYSRTKEDEGRRLEVIDGGWMLLNHAKYRRMASDEERKEQAAVRQQRFRDRHAQNNAPVTPPSRKNNGKESKVTTESRQKSHTDTEAEADSNTEVPEVQKQSKPEGKGTQAELEAYAVEIGLPASDGTAMFDHWTANGWKNGRTPSKCWKAGMRKWKGQGWMPSQKLIHNGSKPRNQAYQGGASATAGKTADQVGNLFGEQQHDEA